MFLSRNVQYRRYLYSRLNYELVSRVQIKERHELASVIMGILHERAV